MPRFWTEHYDSRLQIAGLSLGYDDAIVRGSASEDAFFVFCFAGDRLLCVESVNSPRWHIAAPKLLAAGKTLTKDQAAGENGDLKALATRCLPMAADPS